MPRLIAKERGYYDGRNREPGEEFEANEQDVRLLTEGTRPFARLPADTVQKAPVEPVNLAEPKKRRYLRRDMKAGNA